MSAVERAARRVMVSPVASDTGVSRRMSLQRTRDTSVELAVRRELFRRGLRYRVDLPVIGRRRRVDIAFTRLKVAVFVDGCFWHRCPLHGTLPTHNAEWWRSKLQRNFDRDRESDDQLREAGWVVVRVWEHESTTVAADRVCAALDDARSRTK